MSRDLALAVAAGLLSALLFFSVLSGGAAGLVLTYGAPMPLMLTGLGLGLPGVLVASVVAGGTVAMAGLYPAGIFAASVVLPSLVVTRQALLWRRGAGGDVEWYPPGLVLGWLTAAGLAVLVAAPFVLPGHEGGLEGWIRDYLGLALDALTAGGMVPPEAREPMVAMWAPLLPAMVAGSWLVMALANAVLAQAVLVRFKRNRRPTPDYQALELPDWCAAGLGVSAVLAVVAGGDLGYVARNAIGLLLVPYVFLGLAGMHGAIRQRPNGGILLALFYGAFVLLFGWAVIAAAGVGLVRHLIQLQRRFGGGRDQEGE